MSVQLPDHDPNSVTETRVFVNGRRIPVGDIDIHIRNEGPLDMGYYAEGEFPSPFNGEDYLNLFNTRDENSAMDTLFIDIFRADIGGYVPAFRGMVTGVGNAGGDDLPERMWKFRAQGPAFFLDKIPIEKNFKASGNATILEEIRDQIDDKIPLNVELRVQDKLLVAGDQAGATLVAEEAPDGPVDQTINTASNIVSGTIDFTTGAIDGIASATANGITNVVSTDPTDRLLYSVLGGGDDESDDGKEKQKQQRITKRFRKNKHTVADVASWFSKHTDAFLYFAPRADKVILQPFFSNTRRQHKAHYLGGKVGIVSNNALSEINPINTLTVSGKAADTHFSVGGFDLQTADNEYSQATARHTTLYNRTGGTALHANEFTESGATSAKEVENEARKRLYDRITEATAGDMEVLTYHPIQPHDSITARPTCQSSPATDTEPLTYNVTRVHHKIRANDTSTTRLNVGIVVEDGDIEIVSSGTKEA